MMAMTFVLTERGEKKDERLWIWICLCSAWSNNRIVSFKSSENVKGEKMRLIDADALVKSTDKESVHAWEIALAPTVDAVEVVRCKDCRWGRKSCGNIECSADSSYHGYDWFCANGERREDADT